MTDRPSEIIRAARAWIGTPYLHQASAQGQGCDCLGLVRGVWRDVVGPEPEALPAYTPDWSEASGEERLWRAALRHLQPAPPNPNAPGQVVLLRMRNGMVAKHVGILAERRGATLIHAYSGRGVVETPLSPPWARRIVAQFEFPDRST